ncbi:MAG: HAD family phosphatase [Proteobacteria bacterium]|nr:HAD family phosphatase [Pseudomonadota bacterium]MBU1741898.1 HAD family phosphatase [Pseudomonadota bacterium]
MSSLKAVLFDLDGVILDSMWAHVASWQAVFGRRGLTVSAQFIYENEGALGRDVVEGLFRSAGRRLGTGQLAVLFEEQISLYLDRFVARVKPYPDALDTVAGLKGQGLELALVTSSRRPVVRAGLPAELADQFDVIVTADMVSRFKPDPEPYLKGLEELGVEASSGVAVENAPAGIASAHGAGLEVLALTTTLGPEHLRRARRVFADLADLALHLKI